MKLNLKSGESVRISADGESELRTYVEDGITHVTAVPKGDAAAGIVVGDRAKIIVDPERVYQ